MTTGLSYGTLVGQITSEKGIAGFWDGFVPWGVFQSIGKGGEGAASVASCLVFDERDERSELQKVAYC